jgi:hypothetical protein
MDYQNELLEGRQTLELSARTASQFVRQLGAIAPVLLPPLPGATLGRRPGFQATVLDQKYWFAKLYEIVSYQELAYSMHTDHPGFSLHFMKIFYGMYYDALQNFLNQRYASVSPLWMTHFSGPQSDDNSEVSPVSMEAVQFSVRTGAISHIQGDMPIALVTGYRTWNADPKPSFHELHERFISTSHSAFGAAQARFYIEVNDKIASPMSPAVGQFGAAAYQALFNIQPSLPVMFQWREDSWKKAAASL